jgi:hypothetical protein
MGIFYMNVNIIGRSSGRSATGAAAYRSGQALKSAAYRSGGELSNAGTVHDYTKKKGIVYSEIMLPDNAPRSIKTVRPFEMPLKELKNVKTPSLQGNLLSLCS